MMPFQRSCDPDLPFYHYTGVNERFHSGCLPSFNQPTGNREERLDRVTICRRADPGVFVANRAVIPQQGQLTVCAAHFRPAEFTTSTTHKTNNIIQIKSYCKKTFFYIYFILQVKSGLYVMDQREYVSYVV